MQRRTIETRPPRAPLSGGGADARRGVLAGGQHVSRAHLQQVEQPASLLDAGVSAPLATSRHSQARLEVMRLLRGIRLAQGLGEATMAARLDTSPYIVMALEHGDLAALPEWSETHRIVDRWVAGAGLDPRPALGSLGLALEGYGRTRTGSSSGNREPWAGGERRTVRHPVSGGMHPIPAPAPEGIAARFPFRAPFRLAIGLPPARFTRWAAIVLIGAALATTATRTTVVAGAISKLPAPAERAVRSITDYFAVRFAPVYEGHRWIDVEDPQSRRGDKLRIGRHSD